MADQLMKLKDIEKLSCTVTRVLGQNPGPYTLQGTNTYILGHRKSKHLILLDAGEDMPQYVPLLRQALSEYTGYVRDVILSHYHHDHTLGLKSVLPLLKDIGGPSPRIHKILRSENQNTQLDRPIYDILADLHGHFEPAESEADQNTLRVLATPGHTCDSASFVLQSSGATTLFTADTVLGQGTAVFTDLRALIDSLERCIEEVKADKDGVAKPVQLFCGHGPVVEDGVAKMQEYIAHRLQREQQILQILGKADEPLTAAQIVKVVYGPQLPNKLILAAQNGVILHLQKLEQDGRVSKIPGDEPQDLPKARWSLIGPQ